MRCFLFCDPATTVIYPLSLHDALPISIPLGLLIALSPLAKQLVYPPIVLMQLVPKIADRRAAWRVRSEEHTSELQSHHDLVCRLLLAKKKPPAPPQLRPCGRKATARRR